MAIRRWVNQCWVTINHDDLEIERRQCQDEGLDITALLCEFDDLKTADMALYAHQQRADALLDAVQTQPRVAGYPYIEPSDLEEIRAARPAMPALPADLLDEDTLRDKVLGAWQGRVSGCLLGKPVEGRRSYDMRAYLEAQGRWPLNNYFSLDASPEMIERMGWVGWDPSIFAGGITRMVEDDDTNYTTTGLAIVKQYGADFTPDHVAGFWLSNIPFYHLCTAERIAYRNLVATIAPPDSARYRNVYREWIGAQIRADFFGYVNPGNPERAAAFAWRDASISHIKNGIYGEMWVAAMLAAAYVLNDAAAVIRAGLAQVPAHSRLAEGIHRILELHAAGTSYDAVVADVQSRWDEANGYDWCHTISNAEIVALALLWGELDFERTIGASVMPGFATDCNGATTGSVLGVLLGARQLPAKWIAPLNDTLLTGVAGYHEVSLTHMAEETISLIKKIIPAPEY